jgi:hypothetical protein
MEKQYPVSRKSVAIGAKHELEHTDSIRIARRIARDHLKTHPTYYDVLPYAEKMMAARERNMKAKRK